MSKEGILLFKKNLKIFFEVSVFLLDIFILLIGIVIIIIILFWKGIWSKILIFENFLLNLLFGKLFWFNYCLGILVFFI